MLLVGIFIVDMLDESSKVAFISIEALGIGISGLQLRGISIRSSVCAFSFHEYDSVIFFLYNYVMFKQIV